MDPRLSSFMPSLTLAPSNPTIMATAGPVPEPTPQPEILKKRKRRTTQTGFGFGSNTPSMDLPFPAHAKLTAVELLTFFPLSTRCADVVYRFITNGGTRMTIWAIVNAQRELVTEWSQNSCGNWMYKAMQKAGYTGWTVTIHDRFHAPKKATWDETNLSVGGFWMPGQISGKSEPLVDMSFKNLALDVRQMPTGSDALDLTRMVEYCVQNPKEPWLYPQDYSTLLSQLGGPTKIEEEHTDRAAFARWAGILPPPPRLVPPDPPSEEHNVPQQKRVNTGGAKSYSWGIPPDRATPVSASSSRDTTPMSTAQSRGSTPRRAAPLKRGRPKGVRNKGFRSEALVAAGPAVPEVAVAEHYICKLAEYVPPPKGATEPADDDIELVFVKEHDADESDPQSPYAFGGPRITAPYRMLHKIRQPHPGDKSGWAENLRWAFEQSACFRSTYRADEWNESPEHMQLIAEIRKRQQWASEELEELVGREQDREEESEKLLG